MYAVTRDNMWFRIREKGTNVLIYEEAQSINNDLNLILTRTLL